MRIVVTGAAGQLGRAIVERLSAAATVIPLTRLDLDITDDDAVLSVLANARPDAIINCTAFTRVDAAQTDVVAALNVNGFGVLALARAARATGAVLVHYGTDFVFDGSSDRPYTEEDRPRPQSNYGLSKLMGEWFAADAEGSYVLRVESLFGGPRAKSSVDVILDKVERDQPVRVFTDRTVTPSYVEDVALATRRLLELRPAQGLYHCVNSGVTTWVGIAEEAARLLDRAPHLVPVRMKDLDLPAPRPLYCALSNEKLRAAGIVMPSWQDALARYVAERRERSS